MSSIFTGCWCKLRQSKKQSPLQKKSLITRNREHLSPEAADKYMEFGLLLARWSRAQYVSVVYRDIDHGLGGLTVNAGGSPMERAELHSHCMKMVVDKTIPTDIEFKNQEEFAGRTMNTILCPVPCTGKPEGMISMMSSATLAFTKKDVRLISAVSELLHGEVNALHGDFASSAMVIFDASTDGWKSEATSYNWRNVTGIQTGQQLGTVFHIPADSTIPLTGLVNGEKRGLGVIWQFCLELRPVRQIEHQQLWIGTVLSATDISMELKRQPSDKPDDSVAICMEDINIECLLGKGGFGSVHRAIWQGTAVAVKILEDCGGPTTEVVQEAKIGQRLDHPNLVKTIASGIDYRANGEKFTWIMMELCNRGTLWQAIECGYFRDNKRVDMQKFARTANHIVAGLRYLHENSILHGDLNCNNILMSDEMTAKISDLGLSRVFAGNTLDTDTYGTMSHQPPELLSTGQLSFSSDIYSFGVILFEMYTGKRAYVGIRPAQIMSLKLEGHLLELPKGASTSLKDFVAACMKMEHRERPTLPQIQEWLEDFLATIT